MDMNAIIIKLIEQLNSSVFILLALLGVSYWIVIQTTKVSLKFRHHGDKIEKFEQSLSKISESFIELKTKLNLIYEHTLPKKYVQSNSPISLTDIGKKTVEAIKANKIFENYKSALVLGVESKNPKNPYDIQLVSMQIAKNDMIKLLNEDELNNIKEYAYNEGVLVEDIMSVFGIILRNHILSIKGIPISDVDAHAPKKMSS